MNFRQQGIICLLLLVGTGLNGCARKLPRTVPVTSVELDFVEKRLNSFLDQSCVAAVDSDVRVQWQAYGQQESWPAVLQAMAGGFVRFSVVDPLGRPLLLMAVNGADKTFILAENSRSLGYEGSLHSTFIRKYLPGSIAGSDLFLWLGGRFSRNGMQVVSMRKDAEEPVFWYEIEYPDSSGQSHLVGLDEQEQLIGHLLLDRNGTVLFDGRYSSYTETSMDCSWPGRVEMSGKTLAADLVLEFSKVYSFQPLEKKFFALQLPAHFTVHTVQ